MSVDNIRSRLRPRGKRRRAVVDTKVASGDASTRDNPVKRKKTRPRLRLPAEDLVNALSKAARIKSHAAKYSSEIKEYATKSIYGDVEQAFSSTLIFAQAEGGSAVMVSSSGDIITAAHCLGSSPRVGLQRCLLLSDGTVCVAKATAVDTVLDIALMKCMFVHDGSTTKQSKAVKKSRRSFPWREACSPFAFAEIMRASDPDAAILATADARPSKRSSRRVRQAKLKLPVMCIGQSILARHTNICLSCGQYLGVYQGLDPDMGKLMHSAWTYYGTSGGPLFFRGKLIGVHTSWDSATCTRHGAHWRDIGKFLSRHIRPSRKGKATCSKGRAAGGTRSKEKK